MWATWIPRPRSWRSPRDAQRVETGDVFGVFGRREAAEKMRSKENLLFFFEKKSWGELHAFRMVYLCVF